MSEIPCHYISLADAKKFDKSKLIVKPVKKNVSKNPGIAPWFTSEGKYLNDRGVECTLAFELEKQGVFGINNIYPFAAAEEEKYQENSEGLQIGYPMTTMQTMADPTQRERASINYFDCIFDAVWDNLKMMCDQENYPNLPKPASAAYYAATRNAKVPPKKTEAVKPPYAHPYLQIKGAKEGETKLPDTSKPQRSYIKLMTTGKKEKMKCTTKIYGPGDRQLNYLNLIDVRGTVSLVVMWDGVYYGAHAASPYGTSIRFRVIEMNFTPWVEPTFKRMLGANSDPVIEDAEGDGDLEETINSTSLLQLNERGSGGNNGDEDFAKPEDTGETLFEEEEVPKTKTSSKRREALKKQQKKK